MAALGASHEEVRRLRRLVRSSDERRREGVFVAEGPDLLEAVLDTDWPLEGVYVAEGALGHHRLSSVLERTSFTVVSDAALERIADARSPQGVVAACRLVNYSLDDLDWSGLVLGLEGLHDPGNLGTLIRSADAAGVNGVVVTGDGVDPLHPKVLRSSAGSIFRQRVVSSTVEDAVRWASRAGSTSWATVLRGGEDPRAVDLAQRVLVWIGSEARGLSAEVLDASSGYLSIPMNPAVESLNAAVAGSLVMFESSYQRSHSKGGPLPPSL